MLIFVGIIVCMIGLGQFSPTLSRNAPQAPTSPTPEQLDRLLPTPEVHSLPPTLEQWQMAEPLDDYFSEIEPTLLGYLIWTRFPVRVFVESVAGSRSSGSNPSAIERSQQWVTSVRAAIEEWNPYIPLQAIDSPETADITIWRSAPPLQGWSASEQSGDSPTPPALPRARAAETRYQFFVDRASAAPARISHRFTIYLTPNQTADYTQATARHEIGHALGIWGHSPVETDALYFSQVRHSPPISDRDINTLKRIYQQPTRLGWEISEE
ncbi:peptidase [Egbenema bharatensis]|uniref:peptidase n=1 Tax=Egbenema bharatensis TaxID=3463334 RepID=UPI003A842CAF